jgi:hypothetical protein
LPFRASPATSAWASARRSGGWLVGTSPDTRRHQLDMLCAREPLRLPSTLEWRSPQRTGRHHRNGLRNRPYSSGIEIVAERSVLPRCGRSVNDHGSTPSYPRVTPRSGISALYRVARNCRFAGLFRFG